MQGNPVQKRTQNAFLLGMLIMLVVAVIIGAVLYFFVLKPEKKTEETKEKEETEQTSEEKEEKTITVYQLNCAVESGESITYDKVDTVKVKIPNDPRDYQGVSLTTITDKNETINAKSKLDLKEGTILAKSMIYTDEGTTDSLRYVEYNMLTPQSTLKVGEYIDIRMTMPIGQDYIVLSKKRIEKIDGLTIGLYLKEDEIITATSAIIETYMSKEAINLYITKYVEPGIQDAAVPTYPVNAAALELIANNPNILDTIKAEIQARYNVQQRNYIDAQLSLYAGEQLNNVSGKIQEQKQKSREQYLQNIGGM